MFVHGDPPHVHKCPQHPNGGKLGVNIEGIRMSDACHFENEHDATFKTQHKSKFDAAKGK